MARKAAEMSNPFVTLYAVEDGILVAATKQGRSTNVLVSWQELWQSEINRVREELEDLVLVYAEKEPA